MLSELRKTYLLGFMTIIVVAFGCGGAGVASALIAFILAIPPSVLGFATYDEAYKIAWVGLTLVFAPSAIGSGTTWLRHRIDEIEISD